MKIIAKNKKAFFDFEILKKFMAGLILTGAEAKAIRAGMVNLKGSYVSTRNNQACIENMNIAAYQRTNQPDYEETRSRKLLLQAKEIEELTLASEKNGQTIVPLAIGFVGRFIKIEIAIARGKKVYDKRESIKKRELDRSMKNFK